MAGVQHHYILIGCLLGLLTIPCFADYIYFASPGGGEGADRPGMYGGPVRLEENGAGSKMYISGYHCAVLEEPDLLTDLKFSSISYDPVSKHVLMHVKDQFTLLKSLVCRAQPPNCVDRSNYVTPIFIKRQFSQEIKPVTYFDSTVYFLSYTSETVYREKDAKLELRKFRGCNDEYPVTGNKAFDLEKCSETVATIREERYTRASSFRTADHLIVIRDGRDLRFFTLLKHFEFVDRNMESYKFQLVTIFRGRVEVLDEQEVDKSFNMYSLSQLGGISFKDKTICWSTISRIICADWRGGDIVNRRVILEDVGSSGICKGAAEKSTSNVSTGVTIASTQPDLVVYFGCITELAGKGGMGMIRYKSDGTSEVKNVTNDGNRVLGGSMFITKECKSDKPKPSNGNHSPTISGGTKPSSKNGNQGGYEPEAAGSSYGSSATTVFSFLTYAHIMAAILAKFL